MGPPPCTNERVLDPEDFECTCWPGDQYNFFKPYCGEAYTRQLEADALIARKNIDYVLGKTEPELSDETLVEKPKKKGKSSKLKRNTQAEKIVLGESLLEMNDDDLIDLDFQRKYWGAPPRVPIGGPAIVKEDWIETPVKKEEPKKEEKPKEEEDDEPCFCIKKEKKKKKEKKEEKPKPKSEGVIDEDTYKKGYAKTFKGYLNNYFNAWL